MKRTILTIMPLIIIDLLKYSFVSSKNIMKNSNIQSQSDSELDKKFQEFKTKYNKQYSSDEEERRKKNYKENIYFAIDLTEKAKKYNPNSYAIYGETMYSDLTTKEFQDQYLGLKLTHETISIMKDVEKSQKSYTRNSKTNSNKINNSNAIDNIQASTLIPKVFSWKTQNKVSPFKIKEIAGAAGLIQSVQLLNL